VNELVHLLVPSVSILVLEIRPHSPHHMICPSYISLERRILNIDLLKIYRTDTTLRPN
jgi:hypothetical protein